MRKVAMSNNYITVTALTKYLKRKFEADPHLERVYLTGEISNFRPRPNAHQYFSLKDNQAKISAIMFKGAYQKLKFQPKEGMKVLVVGRISLYEATGNYQIYIEHMEPDGVGALYQALAELKEKLAQEGLFTAPKQLLTKYPKRIAVVTSPSGAVIRDIMTTVERRYPIAELVLFPTVVQGDKSAADICRNLARIEELGNFDTIIVARGGGSIEDLWPFNEERVARAIVNASVPVISSVGHETDVTIADLVADVRAATPTAAAELAVPVLAEELVRIQERENRLVTSFQHHVTTQNKRLLNVQNSFVFKQPERLYEGFSIKLDLLKQRFQKESQQLVQGKKETAKQIMHQLLLQTPKHRVEQEQQKLKQLQVEQQRLIKDLVHQKSQLLAKTIQSLDLLSPLKTMGRGYSYVTKEDELIGNIESVQPADDLTIHLIDGELQVTVNDINITKSEGK